MTASAMDSLVEQVCKELHWTFARSSGPGGQNVNKVASKAVCRWHVRESTSVPAEILARLMGQIGSRITTDGFLVITSQRFRDQDRNRRDCLEKLKGMLARAALPPKSRRLTKATRSSHRRRLDQKRRHSRTKADRRSPDHDN